MENELRRVVDALPGLVWTARADGHIDFLNQRWCEYTGRGVDEAYGEGWQTAIHPEPRSGHIGFLFAGGYWPNSEASILIS
jgi:PAS domain-containing protein